MKVSTELADWGGALPVTPAKIVVSGRMSAQANKVDW